MYHVYRKAFRDFEVKVYFSVLQKLFTFTHGNAVQNT